MRDTKRPSWLVYLLAIVAIAVIVLGGVTVKLVAFVNPKYTASAFSRWVPLTVTDVPPLSGPLLGDTPLTVGGG